MFNAITPKIGSLLLSEPFMKDPNFERAVVLLCEHNDSEGTIGLVLNQPSSLFLSDIFNKPALAHCSIYIGGPVEPQALFFIHRAYDHILSGTPLLDDIYWGGDFDLLLELLEQEVVLPEQVKFFMGYSGWNPQQLEEELLLNSWAVHNSFATEMLFVVDGEDLWKQALISLGPKYAHVANFPKSPEWN